jgi:hypothetical protein
MAHGLAGTTTQAKPSSNSASSLPGHELRSRPAASRLSRPTTTERAPKLNVARFRDQHRCCHCLADERFGCSAGLGGDCNPIIRLRAMCKIVAYKRGKAKQLQRHCLPRVALDRKRRPRPLAFVAYAPTDSQA